MRVRKKGETTNLAYAVTPLNTHAMRRPKCSPLRATLVAETRRAGGATSAASCTGRYRERQVRFVPSVWFSPVHRTSESIRGKFDFGCISEIQGRIKHNSKKQPTGIKICGVTVHAPTAKLTPSKTRALCVVQSPSVRMVEREIVKRMRGTCGGSGASALGPSGIRVQEKWGGKEATHRGKISLNGDINTSPMA